MSFDANDILDVLDRCCDAFTFPMLDNGYVYLAATRLSLYRSMTAWAMVIEVFGFSPRAGLPDTAVQTFASELFDRNPRENYVSQEAYEKYLANNPHNEFRSVFPIQEGEWQDALDTELLAEGEHDVFVRDEPIPLPQIDEYAKRGIQLEEAARVQVFEFCRYLAEIARELVLATARERRISVLPDMNEILQLEEWNHPNVVENEYPSATETFQQLAQVLETGDVGFYRPTELPNTDWRNWPDGGTL